MGDFHLINFNPQWVLEAKDFVDKIMEDAERFRSALWYMENFKNDTKEFYEAKIDACNCIVELAATLEGSFMVKNYDAAKEIVYADLKTHY